MAPECTCNLAYVIGQAEQATPSHSAGVDLCWTKGPDTVIVILHTSTLVIVISPLRVSVNGYCTIRGVITDL